MQTTDLQSLPYHGPPNTPKKLKANFKMLMEIGPGSVVFVLGRWLQPFCSHATYRVRITETQRAGNAHRRIHGTLIDFQDSSVVSVCLPDQQLLRVDLSAREEEKPRLSREDIERIVRLQGLSVTISENRGSVYVVAYKYLSYAKINGRKKSKLERHSLGPFAKVSQMSEEDLASLVRSKFSLEVEAVQEVEVS